MSHARARLLTLMLALSVCFTAGPVLAQAQGTSPGDAERVQVIVTKPAATTGKAKDSQRMADEFKKHSAETTGQSLSMTKAEVWSVPRSELEGLKKMAAKHGATVTELGPESHHLFRAPPADMTMSKKQKAIMDQAKAAKSTAGVKLVMGPAPECSSTR